MDREYACSLACCAGPWGRVPSSLRRRRELRSFLGCKQKTARLGLLCTARRQAPQPTGAPLGPQPAETRDPGIYVWVEPLTPAEPYATSLLAPPFSIDVTWGQEPGVCEAGAGEQPGGVCVFAQAWHPPERQTSIFDRITGL